MINEPKLGADLRAKSKAIAGLLAVFFAASACSGAAPPGSGMASTSAPEIDDGSGASGAAPARAGAGSPSASGSAGSASAAQPAGSNADPSKPLVRPTGPLSLKDAQRYALDLVNRDRAKAGLAPVKWDDTAAKAGARQAKDLALHGYTAHIGTDGSTPELRHTEAGGAAMVMENVACFADAVDREIDPSPVFSVDELERIEKTFIEEVPPMDGHKRNILTAWHTSVGIGLAKTKGLDIVCLAQEFTDQYGEHDALPQKAKVGDTIKVTGKGRDPAVINAVGVARVEKPKPGKAADLMKSHIYAIPKPYVTYFPKGFKTPIPLDRNGSSYSIEVPLNDAKKPGLYEVSVWANVPQTKELVMVSLRTIFVD